MKPGVLWMRHGTCDDGLCRPGAHARPESALTIGGAVEAELTARELRDRLWQPTLVAPSPLRRACQTAVIVNGMLGGRLVQPIATLTEWRAPHCVLGRAAAQYPPDYLIWRDQRARELDRALPGGESLRDFAARAIEATDIARDLATENGPVLLVSHRLLIGAIAALHLGYRHPADIFGFASDFRLAPAHLWAPLRENTNEQP
jgi:probable phosphoglycerate mutase